MSTNSPDTYVTETTGAAYTIDPADGRTHLLTLADDTAFQLEEGDAETVARVTVRLEQDDVGGRTPEWPSDVNWPDGGTEPTWSEEPHAVDYVTFLYDPERGEWDGIPGGLPSA